MKKGLKKTILTLLCIITVTATSMPVYAGQTEDSWTLKEEQIEVNGLVNEEEALETVPLNEEQTEISELVNMEQAEATNVSIDEETALSGEAEETNISDNEEMTFSEEEETTTSNEEETTLKEGDETPDTCDHNFPTEIINAKESTCTEEGYSGDIYCTGCEKVITPGTVIKKKKHELTYHKAKSVTCTKDGRTSYYTCSVCEKYFSDKKGKNEIEKDSWIVKSEGHKITDHVCTVCGYVEKIDKPKLESIKAASDGITITWGKVNDASGYRVFRKTDDGSWKSIGDTKKLSYKDTTARTGIKYTYTVRCINRSGILISNYKKGLQSIILTKPVISVGSNNSYAKVTWRKVKGASGYRIFRKASGEKSYSTVATVSASTRSYKDRQVEDGKKYTYCVKAYTKTTKETVWSKASTKESINFDDGVYRYLAIGNSITYCFNCSIWWNECGMGATTADKDYFHRVAAWLKSNKKKSDSQVKYFAEWEITADRSSTLPNLDDYLKKNLDLVTIQLGENLWDTTTFRNDLIELVRYIQKKSPKAQIIIVDDFWTNWGRINAKYTVSAWYNLSIADLSPIRDDPYYQCGMGTAVYDSNGGVHYIDHEGVAAHPSDLGMEYIANAIIAKIE